MSEQIEAEQECGYVYDHDEEVTHEDAEVLQWTCRRCGAEGFENRTTTPTDASEPPQADTSESEAVR